VRPGSAIIVRAPPARGLPFLGAQVEVTAEMLRSIPVLALALLVGPVARAQEPYVAPSPAPLQAAPGSRPVLELTLDEAVRRTLENNVDIAVERFNPEASVLQIDELKGFYEPVLTSLVTQSSTTRPGSSFFSGGQTVDTDALDYNFGAFQFLRTGGDLRLDFTNRRTSTNSRFEAFNPSYNSDFNLSFNQPFLKNFRTDSRRTQIKIAKKNREISDVTFRQTVVNTVASVKQLYYDLLYSIDNLEAQRKSLSLAAKFLEENQIKVRVGTMAPLDVVQAESEQASREEAVIVADAAVAEAEDALKRAIFNTNDPAMWDTRIVLVERPTAEPFRVDLDAAIHAALESRTDMTAERRRLENAEYNVEFARNQRLPSLDLVASYGTTGLGGTQLLDPITGEPLPVAIGGGFGDAFRDVLGLDFPTWRFGVNLAYPIFNRQAGAAEARSRITRAQSLANIRRLEMQITGEVRSAARAVETNYKRVESTRAARVLQERRLDAETKKFAAGMSTNFLVTQSQRDLAVAEVAQLRAIADYRKSLVNFERVQVAGGGGGGSFVITTGTGQTSTATISQVGGSTAPQQ
jgi:outer membrane protein